MDNMGKLQFAKDVIMEAEKIGVENLKTLAELKEWARNYNKVANEGGEGYVPDVMNKPHVERYEWALKVVAELEPEIEVVEEEIEEDASTESKNVMTIAWEIARKGVEKFGGKVKEFFSAALKTAWKIIKGEVKKSEKYEGVKFHVRVQSWIIGENNIDEIFYSSEETRKRIGFTKENFDFEMIHADSGKADFWTCFVEGVKCRVYVMKA